MSTIRLAVPGMTTRQRVRTVTAKMLDLPGVESVQADHTTTVLTVSGSVHEADIRRALRELPTDDTPIEAHPSPGKH
jgi:copper chaperone CopZ